MSEISSLGQVAFEAYRAEVVTAFNGDAIPTWDKLDNGAPARRGWEAAAQAVREHTRMIDALDASAPRRVEIAEDFRRIQQSRWESLPTTPDVPEVNYGPASTGSFIPAGHGEPPTGRHVAVEASPDVETTPQGIRCKCLDECGHQG